MMKMRIFAMSRTVELDMNHHENLVSKARSRY